MTDTNNPDTDARFETSEVEATRGREQGLGVGARELAAQRDPGGVETADEDTDAGDDIEGGVEVDAGDKDALNQSVGVQGGDDEDEPLGRTSEV